MKKRKLTIIIILLLIIILSGIYLHYQNNKLQVTNYNIINNKIPEDFNSFKIAQISDFHNTKSKTLKNDLVGELEKQKPNIIVITGDFIDANKTDIDIAINFIKRIKDIAPIYFVSGNHEVSTSNYSKLKEELISNNVMILENDIVSIQEGKNEINLIGINDPKIVNDSFIEDKDIVNNELENIYYDKEKYTILLSHRPELFKTYVENNIELVLTGHAHGGQIRIPFVGGVIAPNQGLFPEYTSGLHNESNTTMIISRGIGNSVLPFRINNRPELVIITLNKN